MWFAGFGDVFPQFGTRRGRSREPVRISGGERAPQLDNPSVRSAPHDTLWDLSADPGR